MNFIRKILSKGHNNAQFAFIARGSFGFNRTTMGGQEADLGEIVVSATAFEQDIKEAPATISVISKDEIEKKNHKDVADVVKDVPGVYSAPRFSSMKGKSDIRMRGMDSKYTKVLIDGRPVSSESAFPGFGSQGSIQSFVPPANAIERVEVIRGPMSSLYGTDAMGGVINIITKGFLMNLAPI